MSLQTHPTYPLPDNPAPPLDLCLQINIPNDRQYYQMLWSVIRELTYWFSWDRDQAHTGRVVAQTWRDILDTLRVCPTTSEEPGVDCGDCMGCCLRFQDGVLQCLACGVWTAVPGQPPGGLFSGGQPGGGTPVPGPGGGEQCWNGYFQAADTWLVPYSVNAGDVLTLSEAGGAGTNGTNLLWYCPDGSEFFLGSCENNPAFDGADLVPTLPHMRLLYRINNTYYDAMNGPFTVPSGISNAQVLVEANRDTGASSSGSFNFKLCATNNQAGSYSHQFDFTQSPGGWTIANAYVANNPFGQWSAGNGFRGTAGDDHNGHNIVGCAIKTPPFTSHITSLTVVFDSVAGTIDGSTDFFVQFQDASGNLYTVPLSSVETGNSLHFTWTGDLPAATLLYIFVQVSQVNQPGTADGSCLITSATVTGIGSDPF